MNKQRVPKVDNRKDGDRGFEEAKEKDRRQRYCLCEDGVDRVVVESLEPVEAPANAGRGRKRAALEQKLSSA
ncbi:hypothetical protein [Mesorhizobium sp. Root695]|uniref:hypothetical protein n=1 Tax=Mesorhizobium sp. Root695 TaxID=1736589 RepID=UPI001FCDA42F|nr:hypothetical protein [Mesorhizobium sp. Root695]